MTFFNPFKILSLRNIEKTFLSNLSPKLLNYLRITINHFVNKSYKIGSRSNIHRRTICNNNIFFLSNPDPSKAGWNAVNGLGFLWNPDFNVDAAIDAYCRNMYGPAAKPVRKTVC